MKLNVISMFSYQTYQSKKQTFYEMFKMMDNPNEFIESCPDSIPYRTLPSIHKLFEKLGFSISNTYVYDSCTVAEIDNSSMH